MKGELIMHSEHGKWVFSHYDEIFNSGEFYDTKEEAIEAGKEMYTPTPTFYVGQVQDISFSIGVNVDNILEEVEQDVYDEVGEVATDYLNGVTHSAKSDLENRLNAVFDEWMKEHNLYPTFFKVINIEKISPEYV